MTTRQHTHDRVETFRMEIKMFTPCSLTPSPLFASLFDFVSFNLNFLRHEKFFAVPVHVLTNIFCSCWHSGGLTGSFFGGSAALNYKEIVKMLLIFSSLFPLHHFHSPIKTRNKTQQQKKAAQQNLTVECKMRHF